MISGRLSDYPNNIIHLYFNFSLANFCSSTPRNETTLDATVNKTIIEHY